MKLSNIKVGESYILYNLGTLSKKFPEYVSYDAENKIIPDKAFYGISARYFDYSFKVVKIVHETLFCEVEEVIDHVDYKHYKTVLFNLKAEFIRCKAGTK